MQATSTAALSMLLLLSAARPAVAQSLLTDIERTPARAASGNPRGGTAGTTQLFFLGDGPDGAKRLHRTDGTADGTHLVDEVTDLFDTLQDPLADGDAVYYARVTGLGAARRVELRHAGSGAPRALYTSSLAAQPRALLGGRLLFLGGDASTTGVEPWVTDGTVGGTILLRDITPGSESSLRRSDVPDQVDWPVLGGLALFAAHDPQHGAELWATDATPAGTRLVADLEPGVAGSAPTGFVVGGGTVWFVAETATHGHEVWRSDGTAAGTLRVTDLAAGPASLRPRSLHFAAGKLFLIADEPMVGEAVWSVDTATGVALRVSAPLQDPTSPGATRFAPLGQRVVFHGSQLPLGREPWISDGTPAGTGLLADLVPGAASSEPGPPVAFQGEVWFTARTAATGRELWRTDGTGLGTRRVTDLDPGVGDGVSRIFGQLGGHLFLDGRGNALGREPWRIDASGSAPQFVADTHAIPDTFGSDPRVFAGRGGVFSARTLATGREPWITDGTRAGTRLLADLSSSGDSDPSEVAWIGGATWFAADDGVHGREPHIVDAAGLRSLDLRPGSEGSRPSDFIPLGGRAVFVAADLARPDQRTLWISDGTAPGTLVLLPGSQVTTPPVALGDRVLFGAPVQAQFGNQGLWVSDGTPAGTRLLVDLAPGWSANLRDFVRVGDRVFFSASQYATGQELWCSDGTVAGTRLVRDLAPGRNPTTQAGDSSDPRALTPFGERLLFFADDGVHGRELWVSDGTAPGTRLVADTVPGPGSPASEPESLVVTGARACFALDNGVHGLELWATDGTAVGTGMVRDLQPGSGSALRDVPGVIAPLGSAGVVVFEAESGADGIELWISDGTAAGTRLLADLAPQGDSEPAAPGSGGLAVLGRTILFSADDGVRGREPWTLDVAALGQPLLQPFGEGCGLGGPGASIGGQGLPRVGASFAVTLRGVAPGRSAFLLWGQRSAALALGACRVLVADPEVFGVAATAADGSASLALQVPAVPSLVGVELDFQWAVDEPGGPLLGVVSLSDGLLAVIGG